jgi:hypothetical protein
VADLNERDLFLASTKRFNDPVDVVLAIIALRDSIVL